MYGKGLRKEYSKKPYPGGIIVRDDQSSRVPVEAESMQFARIH